MKYYKKLNKNMFKLNLKNILLYLTFIVTLLNISYFISIEEYQSLLAFVVMISVSSMFTTNLFILLLIGIVGMNLFFMIKEDTIENMENQSLDMSYNSFKSYVNDVVQKIDTNTLDVNNRDFVLYIKSNYKLNATEYYVEFKNRYRQMSDTKWVDKNIINFKDITIQDEKENYKTSEPFSNESDDMKIEDQYKLENIINKIKETSPELTNSLEMIKSIDINQMNKLINNVNSMIESS
jgi:hypothetical protein